MAQPQRIARAGPSKEARKPSPAVSASFPRKRLSWRRTRSWWRSSSLPPGAVAERGGALGRAHDVGEEDGGQHPVGLGLLPGARLPDLGQEALLLIRVRGRCLPGDQVPAAGQLDEARSRNAIGHVLGYADGDDRVLGSMDDESGYADRRQDVADVDLLVHQREGLNGSRAPAPAEVVEPLIRLSVVAELNARPHGFKRLVTRAEQPPVALHLLLILPLGPAPRVVGRPHRPRVGAAQHQSRGALWIRGREEKTHRGTLRATVERRPLRAHCVHDRPHIVHARLEGGRAAHAIRHSRPPLVEPDKPTVRGHLAQDGREGGDPPDQLNVREEWRNENVVEWSVARDLVGDGDVAALRVVGLRLRDSAWLGYRGDRTRTCDPRFWRPMLYQLSYAPRPPVDGTSHLRDDQRLTGTAVRGNDGLGT